jgi:hypothetical protein
LIWGPIGNLFREGAEKLGFEEHKALKSFTPQTVMNYHPVYGYKEDIKEVIREGDSPMEDMLYFMEKYYPRSGLVEEAYRDKLGTYDYDPNLYAGGGIAGIRRPWAIPPESGPDPQGIIPRPGYQQGNRVNPFEETGNLPGGAYDRREYITSPILKDNKGITTVEAPPKEDKRTFEEIIESVVGKAKDRPKYYKLDEEGNIITPRAGPMARRGTGDVSMEYLNKVIGAVGAANLSKEKSDYFWNKFGIEFGLSGNELKSLKEGKKFLKKENIPLISLDEDALLSFTKGLDLPGNTAATIFAESNLGGDINASLELANKYFKTKITEDDVSWDIKPTFDVGKIDITSSVILVLKYLLANSKDALISPPRLDSANIVAAVFPGKSSPLVKLRSASSSKLIKGIFSFFKNFFPSFKDLSSFPLSPNSIPNLFQK